jgi:hypothetical protein
MTPPHTTNERNSILSLALIPKPGQFEIVLASAQPDKALTVESRRPSKPRAVSSIDNLHNLPGSWIRGGINE